MNDTGIEGEQIGSPTGVGGPVGSGKTALLECLVPLLMKQGIGGSCDHDLLTQEDADRLKRKDFCH